MKRSKDSPYVRNANRLADVLAAIQAMGSYKYYKLPFEQWADRISGDPSTADHWRNVFEEHPEFFRLDSERKKASLIWRRQHPKRFHIDQDRLLSRDEFEQLDASQKLRVSRVALAADDIQALMQAAIDLHSRAMEHQRERRWWIPLIASALGGLFGAIAGAAMADDVAPTVDTSRAVPSSSAGAQGAGSHKPGSHVSSSGFDPSRASQPGPEPVVHGPLISWGYFDSEGRVDYTVLTQAQDEVTPVQTLGFVVNPQVTGAICELPPTLEFGPAA